jgi:hypothetical protein
VGGTSSGIRYQQAGEHSIDLCITCKDDHLVDIEAKLKNPRVLREFRMNPNTLQSYHQRVTWITRQYDLATYRRAVDSYFANTTLTKGDCPLSRFGLIESPLDEMSWDDCLMFADIEGHLMVTFVTINKTVMVDDVDSKPSVIDLLLRSEAELGVDKLDDMEEEESREGKDEIQGIGEDQYNSDPEIKPITNIALLITFSCQTAEDEDEDFDNQHAEEIDQIHPEFDQIALTDLE